jgi:hypothetical protein
MFSDCSHWFQYDPKALAMLAFLAAFAALLIAAGALTLHNCGC